MAPDGRLQCYYCNISVPPAFDGETLSYVDLDIDLLVQPDLSYRILDREDFESNAALFSYSDALRQNVERALNEVIALIESRVFPFNE